MTYAEKYEVDLYKMHNILDLQRNLHPNHPPEGYDDIENWVSMGRTYNESDLVISNILQLEQSEVIARIESEHAPWKVINKYNVDFIKIISIQITEFYKDAIRIANQSGLPVKEMDFRELGVRITQVKVNDTVIIESTSEPEYTKSPEVYKGYFGVMSDKQTQKSMARISDIFPWFILLFINIFLTHHLTR